MQTALIKKQMVVMVTSRRGFHDNDRVLPDTLVVTEYT